MFSQDKSPKKLVQLKSVTGWCMCVFKGGSAVNLPVYGLPSGSVLHLVSLATQHINDRIVAEEVTCDQKEKKKKSDDLHLRMLLMLSNCRQIETDILTAMFKKLVGKTGIRSSAWQKEEQLSGGRLHFQIFRKLLAVFFCFLFFFLFEGLI